MELPGQSLSLAAGSLIFVGLDISSPQSVGGKMTEILETEVLQAKLSEEVTLQEALNLIDRGLSDASDRSLVSAVEFTDLLLDVRGILVRLGEAAHSN